MIEDFKNHVFRPKSRETTEPEYQKLKLEKKQLWRNLGISKIHIMKWLLLLKKL